MGKAEQQEELEWEDRAKMAHLIREYLYVPDGEPPVRWSMARCMSVVKMMKRYGQPEEEIRRAVRGAGVLRDEGKLGSLAQRGEKMTMRIFVTAKNHGIPLYNRARHEMRKREAGRRDGPAAETISAALQAAAGGGGGE